MPASAPGGYPIVGHLPPYLHDRLSFLLRCDDGSGRAVRLRLGRVAYLLTDAADVEHVLLRNVRNYTKTPRLTAPRGRRLLGHGLLTSTGAEHLERRRLLQPLFSRRRVGGFGEIVTEVADEIAAGWDDGLLVDVVAEMTTLSRRVIVRALLGRRSDENELERALEERQRYIEYRFRSLFPLPELAPRPVVAGHRRAVRQIDRALRSAIATRRVDKGAFDDLLAHLVDTGLSDDDVRDEALVLLVTGYETVAVALAWTWYLLALHPEAEARVQREADGFDLHSLPYTEAVLSEAVRLYPPTWIFVRVALGADRLPSGLEIPSGAKLYLSQYVVHRSPRYFADPDRFDPGRFAADERPSRPEFAYFPFGGGVRLCIGKPFALLEGVLTLATIARRFRLALETDRRVRADPGVTLRPRGPLRMRVHAR
jgi:cytochrome P450